MSDPHNWGVVLINWNTPAYTIESLASVWAARRSPRRIVLVDNASADSSVEKILGWARERGVTSRVVDAETITCDGVGSEPWLLLATSRRNRGFAANNNRALRYFRDCTDVSHVLLLNNDATVEVDFFQELSRAVAARPDGGLFTGSIYWDPDRNALWYAGGSVNPLRALVTHRTTPPASSEPAETAFVSGCAMLIARNLLERVGLLPECYDPVYCEDADYSLRARAAGFSLIFAPRAKVYHKFGGTVGDLKASPRITFYVNRHRGFLVRRNYRGWRRLAGLTYLVLTKPGRAIVETLSGRPRIGWATFKGMVAGIFSRAANA